jgi:hypothetical protein
MEIAPPKRSGQYENYQPLWMFCYSTLVRGLVAVPGSPPTSVRSKIPWRQWSPKFPARRSCRQRDPPVSGAALWWIRDSRAQPPWRLGALAGAARKGVHCGKPAWQIRCGRVGRNMWIIRQPFPLCIQEDNWCAAPPMASEKADREGEGSTSEHHRELA